VITGVAVFFSSFSTPFLSGLFTLSVFLIGHLTEDLKAFSSRFEGGGRALVNLVYYGLPNLETLNIKGAIVHGQFVSWNELAWRLAIGVSWCIVLLVASILIFQRREFK